MARLSSLARLRSRARPLRMGLRLLLPLAVFAASLLPLLPVIQGGALTDKLAARARTVPVLGPYYARLEQWHLLNVTPVEELRPLAPWPDSWQGRWIDTDRNYARFEKWFADHLGLRNLMIRSKNEADYRLFRSSSRVYYGKGGELYGRNLADNELPLTEAILAAPRDADAIYRGVLDFSARLRAQGVTMILIAPIEKQYFTRERLPFFAPRVPDASHFMALYQRLKAAPQLHFIDVDALLREKQHTFPIFFRQDFHWTDLMAMTVAQRTTDLIAHLEQSPLRWRHPLVAESLPFVGVEARFAARLNADDIVFEPQLKKTWTERHVRRPLDAQATGFEFDTATLDAPDLLPPVCMYGNSFSDGMLRAGMPEHFQSFSKLSRALPLPQVPALMKGRCKYLVVQVLDIQASHWKSLALAPDAAPSAQLAHSP